MADMCFTFYENFDRVIKKAPEEFQLEIYKAITAYGLYGEMPEGLSFFAETILQSLIPTLDNTRRSARGNAKQKVSDEEIEVVIKQLGPKASSADIAEALGKRISADAIRKRDVWKNRKNYF